MGFFTKATRERTFLKMVLDGPSGSGKSFTALRFAFAMLRAGLVKRVGVLETESRKILKYAGYNVDGSTWDFDHGCLTEYSPRAYMAAIAAAAQDGIDCLIIDSLSHEWQGAGGALEMVDKFGDKAKFTSGWKEVTPQHNRFIDSILRAPCHVIATMRTKTEYLLEKVTKGDREITVPRKVGMKPIQRDGVDYEFEIHCSLDTAHVLTVQKTICPAIDRASVVEPDGSFMTPIISWLREGVVNPNAFAPRLESATVRAIVADLASAGADLDVERDYIAARYGASSFADLNEEDTRLYRVRVQQIVSMATKRRAALAQAQPGETLQDALASLPTQQPAPIREPDASPLAAWTGGLHPLFEELFALKGVRYEQKAGLVSAFMSRAGVATGEKPNADQAGDLSAKLKAAINAAYAARGTADASPYYQPEPTTPAADAAPAATQE